MSLAQHSRCPWRDRGLAVIVLLLAAIGLCWSMLSADALRVDVGEWGDHAFLQGINGVEQSSTESYRWTTDHAVFALPNLGPRYRLLDFRAQGWRPNPTAPPQLALGSADHATASIQMRPENRVYHVLLPWVPMQWSTGVSLDTAPFRPPGDRRTIGIAIDWIALRANDTTSGPAPLQFVGQVALIGLLLWLVQTLALPRAWSLAASGAALALPLVANMVQPLWVSAALPAWLLLVAALLLASRLVGPRAARWFGPWLDVAQARIAWALLVAALLIRLFGATHPLFDMHDLPYHTRWLTTTASGELYIYSTPAEFHSRTTFNPPAGYVLLMPLTLVLDPRLAVQVGVALLDAVACLLILLIARALKLPARAALLALAASVALPISLAMLWWGFATNALAQPIWLLLVLVVLHLADAPMRAWVALLIVVTAVGLLTHVGALVLVAATLALLLLLLLPVISAPGRLALLGGLSAAAVLAAALYFSLVLPRTLAPSGGSALASVRALGVIKPGALADRWQLFSRGLVLGFTPLGLALAVFGFVALLRGPYLPRVLALAWLGATGAAVATYFTTGLVVRDLYFLAPLVCLALGVALDGVWTHGGRLVALAVLGFITWQGLALWVGGVLSRLKPSATMLTR